MIKWIKELSLRLEKLGIKNQFIPRYVDDISMCPNVIPPGWKFRNGKLLFDESEVNKDKEIHDDKRTMEIIKEVADEICENIEVTYDVPSNHHDKKVPILA